MNILSIVFLAIATSSDSLIVGLSYSAKKVNITPYINFIISMLTGLTTFIIMILGDKLRNMIPLIYTNIIGGILLMLLGTYFLISFIKNSSIYNKSNTFDCYNNMLKNPEKIDTDNSKNIEWKEAILLSLVLSLNNIGLAFGASIAGLNMYLISICAFIFSFVFIHTGLFIGKIMFSNKLTNYSEIISAIMIIIVGIYELLF